MGIFDLLAIFNFNNGRGNRGQPFV